MGNSSSSTKSARDSGTKWCGLGQGGGARDGSPNPQAPVKPPQQRETTFRYPDHYRTTLVKSPATPTKNRASFRTCEPCHPKVFQQVRDKDLDNVVVTRQSSNSPQERRDSSAVRQSSIGNNLPLRRCKSSVPGQGRPTSRCPIQRTSQSLNMRVVVMQPKNKWPVSTRVQREDKGVQTEDTPDFKPRTSSLRKDSTRRKRQINQSHSDN